MQLLKLLQPIKNNTLSNFWKNFKIELLRLNKIFQHLPNEFHDRGMNQKRQSPQIEGFVFSHTVNYGRAHMYKYIIANKLAFAVVLALTSDIQFVHFEVYGQWLKRLSHQ